MSQPATAAHATGTVDRFVAREEPTRWDLAIRPLRRRGLLVQLAMLVAAEVLLLHSYDGRGAALHWAIPFMVGLTAAAFVNLTLLALKGAPARGQLLWVLGLHLYAMAPDLVSNLRHAGWMDVFLGHDSARTIPGGAATWLAVAIVASGAYGSVLSRWLRARRLEAAAGMAPGVGLGGDALTRAQRSPAVTTLAHRGSARGDVAQVLLLHGLGASHSIWEPVRKRLRARGIATLVPDLLGFGGSRSIGTSFDLDDHVDALLRLLDESRAQTVLVAGHSYGCAVAVALARRAPERVSGLVLVSPPVFRDSTRARERLARRDWLTRKAVKDSPIAGLTCALMCLLRRPLTRVLARAVRRVPSDIARDSVQHSWPAYRDALDTLLEHNPLPVWISAPQRPTTVVLSDEDREAPAGDVLDFEHDAVDVVALRGDHLIVLSRPEDITQVIVARVDETERRRVTSARLVADAR